MWERGIVASTTSSPGSSQMFQAFPWTTFATRLRCVNIAAFGRPVVPPVYWRTATLVRGSDGTRGTDPASATAVLHGRTEGSRGRWVGSFCLRRARFTPGRRYHG